MNSHLAERQSENTDELRGGTRNAYLQQIKHILPLTLRETVLFHLHVICINGFKWALRYFGSFGFA